MVNGEVNYYGQRDEFSRGSVSLRNSVDTGCYTVDVSSYQHHSELRGWLMPQFKSKVTS